MTKIHELYEAEKNKKEKDVAAPEHVALTGDHWTSVSNDHYLGVTAHLITDADTTGMGQTAETGVSSRALQVSKPW